IAEIYICILWYKKIQALPGWEEDWHNAGNFKWVLHVQDEAAAQRVLPLEVPPGRSYADVLAASLTDAAAMRQTTVTALQKGQESYSQEFCCRDMFGQLRWLREDVQIQRLAEDRWEAFGLTTDVTTRKQAREEILRLNRDLQDRVTDLQTLLDTVPIGIAIATDQHCSKVSVNPYLARLLGIAADPNASLNAPQNLRLPEFTLCRDGKELAPEQLPMRLAALGQVVTYMELEIVRSDGELIPVMSSAVPLLDMDGKPRGCVAAFTDISERIRTEEGLRNVASHTGCILWHGELKEIKRSDEELQQGFPRFAWRVQIQDEKAAQKVLPLDVLPGTRYEDVWQSSQDPEDKAQIESLCAANLQMGRTSWSHEYRCTNRFGEIHWFYESVRVKQRRPGRWQVFGVFLDMTERKRANEEMARLAAIVESSDDAIISATCDGYILTWNAGAERLFGYSAEEVKGRQISMLIPEDHEEEAREIDNQVSSGQQIPPFETVRRRSDGTTVQVALSVSPVRDSSGKITGVAVTARDVSPAKRLEKDVLDISAHEQQRIGQDLHDGICQQLTGAYFLTSVLKHKLDTQSSGLAADASQIASLLSTVTEQARQLARGLHPLETGAKGLHVALMELADQISHLFRIECRFVCEQEIAISDNATATHIYRIAQEASNNAVRHGEATHISIELRQNSGEIWLIVEDNGKGFHNEIDSFSGMGLRTMRYRAGVIGGKLIIESGRPGGTLICCVVPIQNACPTAEVKENENLHGVAGD
ncbi:MAG: PAS domain S-box protein, partial [Verrucomicrobiaceae bacterium]